MFGADSSPGMTWTPVFDDAVDGGCDGFLSAKNFDFNAFTSFEALQMDDLINNDACSSTSSTGSDRRHPTSSLHNLPAWSTSEEGDEWSGSSPVNSDGATGDDAAVNDVWFAPSKLLSRKKRTSVKKNALLAEDRQTSPGAATANLKSHKSAPQLVKKHRVTSSDHQAKLQDLLIEMGWPRESSKATAAEAVDAEYGSSGTQSYQGQSHTASAYNTHNSGAGSLASGMPVTNGALFRRRAANNKEGDMPAPSQVAILDSEDATTSMSLYGLDNTFGGLSDLAHSRSATFPLSHQVDSAVMPRPMPVTSMSSSFLNQAAMTANTAFTSQHNDSVKKQQQFQEALYYGLNSATQQRTPLLVESPFLAKTPDTGNSSEMLQTPVTPFQGLSTGDMSIPYSYSASPSSLSSHLMPAYSYPVKATKTPADLDVSGTFGNSLGLSYMPTMNQLYQQQQQQRQQQPPAMIDSSSYGQIFANMKVSNQQSPSPSLKQMRSSPNMRVTVSTEGSPIRSPIRKIASNRRLTVSNSDNSNLSNSSMSPPIKTSIKKGKSPKVAAFAIPSLPLHSYMPMSSPNIHAASSTPSSSSFEFVNYGIEDADELCSAVAPSGSYKVPLKGFGGSQDEDEDEDGQDEAADQEDDDSERRLHRSRSKSNSRLGPRWQGLEGQHEEQANLDVAAMEKALRQVKRRKSEASMMLSSHSKKKSASSGNLRKRD